MTLPIVTGYPSGCRFTVMQAGLYNASLTVGTPTVLNLQTTNTLQPAYFIAYTPVTISAVTGYVYLVSGSTTGTVSFSLQYATMTTATSGTGGTASGSFTTIATTGSITPSTTGGAVTPYTNSIVGATSYAAGTIFQIVINAATAATSALNCMATLRIVTQV